MRSLHRVSFSILTIVLAVCFGIAAGLLPPGLPERLCTMMAIIMGIAIAPFALLLAVGSLLAPVNPEEQDSSPAAPAATSQARPAPHEPPATTDRSGPKRGRRAA